MPYIVEGKMFVVCLIILGLFSPERNVSSAIIADILDTDDVFPRTLRVDDEKVIQTDNGQPMTDVYDLRELRKLCARIQAQHLLDTSIPAASLDPLRVKILDRWSISAVLSPSANLDELIDQVPADWPEFQTKIVKGTRGRKKRVMYCFPLHYRDYNYTESEDIDNVVNDFFIAPADSDSNIILVSPHTPLIFDQDPDNVDGIIFHGYEDTLKFIPRQNECTLHAVPDSGGQNQPQPSCPYYDDEQGKCQCNIL